MAGSCFSGQGQLADAVLLALAGLESAELCSGREQLVGVLLALAELAELCSDQEQLAGVVLALARVEAWKEEAVAVKT